MQFGCIASGSSGNCIYIGTNKTHLLIDAGISKKRIIEGLNLYNVSLDNIDALLVTHEHIDHIKSLGVINRAIDVPIYCTRGTLDAIKNYKLGQIDYSKFKVIDLTESFQIGDIVVTPISTSHDALEPCSYRFDSSNNSIGLITDTGTYDSTIVSKFQNLDAIIIEANHDIKMLETGRYPYELKVRVSSDIGHLSNEQAGEFLNEIIHPNLNMIYLAHLSKDNNFDELAIETIKLEVTLDKRHNINGNDLNINVARRDEPTELVEL